MSLKLVIGNRNYSSWSLRAWLYLRESQIPFEEIRIPLFTEQWSSTISEYSPARKVPVIVDGDITVWDTMAIFEYLRENYDTAVDWPEEISARAEARAVSAEMHAGFMGVREELPQNIKARIQLGLSDLSEAAQSQIQRICHIWSSCRNRYNGDGPWLYGQFSIADVMYAPVALRFVTYEIPVPDRAQEFINHILNLSSIQEWTEAAKAEKETLDFIDNIKPLSETPITFG